MEVLKMPLKVEITSKGCVDCLCFTCCNYECDSSYCDGASDSCEITLPHINVCLTEKCELYK